MAQETTHIYAWMKAHMLRLKHGTVVNVFYRTFYKRILSYV